MKKLWNKTKNWLNTNNHLLWVSIIALIALGIVTMYFVGPYEAARYDARQLWGTDFFFNKFWPYALVGTIILFACSRLSKKWVIRTSWIFGVLALLLILKTIISPIIIHGSSRYVHFGRAYIDPFILMLPPYIVLMSHWLSKNKPNKTWTTIGTTVLTLFIIWAAVQAPYIFIAQVYLLLFFIITFKARKNVPGPFYVGVGILVVFAALIAFAVWHFPHIQHRIVNFNNYSAQMSLRAIASSALVGNTSESLTALSRLPGSISDFAFTSIIAKFGILMGLLVLVLYGCITKGLTATIRNAKDKFNKMLSTGTLGMFAIYTIMALMVAFGILATAAYWPFISMGGTMFLVWSVLFGFVIAMNKK